MLLSNLSSKYIIDLQDCLQKGKSDTKMFKNDLFIKRNKISNRNGLLLFYFKRKLPEPFPREKIPKASIIVSLAWKLRFTSNIGIKPGFPCINICYIPREVLKTEVEDRGEVFNSS